MLAIVTSAHWEIDLLQGKKDGNSSASATLAECEKKECARFLFQVAMRVHQQQQKDQEEEKEKTWKELQMGNEACFDNAKCNTSCWRSIAHNTVRLIVNFWLQHL